MNYLLQDAPTIQLMEIEQPNILVGLIVILVGVGIINVIINAIFRTKKRSSENEES